MVSPAASSAEEEGYQRCVNLKWYQVFISDQFNDNYDTMWDPVMKAFPKVDESESGQMVLK